MLPEADPRCLDVTAVVVTYRPDPGQLDTLLAALRLQVGRIVIVDNATPAAVVPAPAADGDGPIEWLRNPENLGIGAAQNIGAARALARADCAYVLLSDQDSVPAPHMVRRLRAALAGAPAAGAPLAAVGPWSVDTRTGVRATLVLDRGRGPRRWRPPAALAQAGADQAPPIDVAFLLASGTLVPAAVLRALRGMRGGYFIDHVDTEWCLRARAAGYRLAVVPQARLEHRLGDAVRRVWFFGAREVAWHAPLRDYYMFRNTLLLLRDTPVGRGWRFYLLRRLLLFAGYFLAWGDRRRDRLRLMLRGLGDGLRGRSGRLAAAGTGCEPIEPQELDPGRAAARRAQER